MVLEPRTEKLPFKFQRRLLFAFVEREDIEHFLEQVPHVIAGKFETISFSPNVYEVDYHGEKFTLCQAPLGAPAATQLLDWLISYGVERVLAFGNAGALIDLPENAMLIPIRALRDEGTSFHYIKPSQFVDLQSTFLDQIEDILNELGQTYAEITTWTTDGFFRETPRKVKEFRHLGAAMVEMECAGMAACAQFRKIDFAPILFAADSLADVSHYDYRSWGAQAHRLGLEIGAQVLAKL